MEVLEIIKSRGYSSGASARTRTAVAEAVSCERLVWARGDIRGLWEGAKLTDNRRCLQHLRQVEVCRLQVTIAIRQPVFHILKFPVRQLLPELPPPPVLSFVHERNNRRPTGAHEQRLPQYSSQTVR